MISLCLSGIFFKDGSQFVYHGVNIIPAFPPYFPDTQQYSENFSFTIEDIEFLKQNNFNMIVLQYMLPAVFPTENLELPNYDYFDRMNEVIELCEDNNISVIISLYDHYISELNCGQGMPSWVLGKDSNETNHEYPLPSLENIERYDNESVTEESCSHIRSDTTFYDSDAYAQLYSNSSFYDIPVQFWYFFLRKSGDKFTNIIAYELFTEPQASVFSNVFNKEILPEFYQRILSVFVAYNSSFEIPIILNGAMNDVFTDFADHCSALNLVLGYANDESIISSDFESSYETYLRNCQLHGYASFVSSFGRFSPLQNISSINSVIFNESWAYFTYKGYGDNYARSLTNKKDDSRVVALPLLSVPYFSKIAGNLIRESFNYTTMTLSLKYRTGKISDYSILDIGESWRLFGTAVQFSTGDCAVEVIIDNGKIKIKNVAENVIVDLVMN